MERRKFAAGFRREAAKLASQVGVSKTKFAEEPGIHANVLTRRVREARAGKWKLSPGKPLKTEQQAESRPLRPEPLDYSARWKQA